MGVTRRFHSQRQIWLALTGLLGCIYFFGNDIRWVACATSSPLLQHSVCSNTYQDGEWDLFYHLGGNGPWIPKADGVGHPDDPLPKGCAVDQVHLLSRHGERFPTRNSGSRHIELLEKLHSDSVQLKDSLSFVKSWQYFTDPSDPQFENLTTKGPYAGTTQARSTGKKFRQRYDHIVNNSATTQFWTCSSGRDIETARCFGDGFFGTNWEKRGVANLQIISEDPNRGGDTLTPGETCGAYVQDTRLGHDYGYHQLVKWQEVLSEPIIERLASKVEGINLSPRDIYSMMEMCGFEILARGSSPWCGVFTREEWLDFEYARDLLHFYRAGPGNQYAGSMGWLWLDATTNLLQDSPEPGVFFSFVHDGDIAPLLATLQVLDERTMLQQLPATFRKDDRKWRISDVLPMGGRVVFERVTCGGRRERTKRSYVRLFINDAQVQIPGTTSGDGLEHSSKLDEFRRFVNSRLEYFGPFSEVCRIPADDPQQITFLHQ